MPSIPELAYAEALRQGLDLGVERVMVPTSTFKFKCIDPKRDIVDAFRNAMKNGQDWVKGMPLPVLVYHRDAHQYRIMDGMMRICAAQKAHVKAFPSFVARGETYDALEHILREGYYGEDFMELLAMENEAIRRNIELRDSNRMAGK